MDLGIPYSLNTFYMKAVATLAVVKGWDNGRKCTYLVSLSTTTKMTSNPWDLGKPSIKSILMSNQGFSRISKGCNNPVGLLVSTLILWQTSQHLIWFLTLDFIPFQKKSYLTRWRVFKYPEWPLMGLSWTYCKTNSFKEEEALRKILSLYKEAHFAQENEQEMYWNLPISTKESSTHS